MNDKGQPTEAENVNNSQPGYLGRSAPPGKAPTRGERAWIDRPEQLRHAVDILKQAKIVAVFAEILQVGSHIPGGTQKPPHPIALPPLFLDQQPFFGATVRPYHRYPLS